MRLAFSVLVICLASNAGARAQTTIPNLDDDPITYPNQTSSNLRSWGSSTGVRVGCGSACQVSGSMSHTSYYQVDGQSLQLNLNNPSACPSNCYGDVDFSNKIFQDNATASSANNFTLDLYATMDAVGNAKSQGLEFTIEQDVPSTTTSGSWDRYIYSWQCDYKNTHTWNVWNGAYVNASGVSQPRWEPAITTSGATVPCDAFESGGKFTHFYFHFLRLPGTRSVEFLDFTAVKSDNSSTYHQFNQIRGIQPPEPNWGTGLFTAVQLDGDYFQDQYSVWVDNLKVAFQ